MGRILHGWCISFGRHKIFDCAISSHKTLYRSIDLLVDYPPPVFYFVFLLSGSFKNLLFISGVLEFGSDVLWPGWFHCVGPMLLLWSYIFFRSGKFSCIISMIISSLFFSGDTQFCYLAYFVFVYLTFSDIFQLLCSIRVSFLFCAFFTSILFLLHEHTYFISSSTFIL